MSYGYLNNEIDSMFENEHNDMLLSDKLLWNNDNFYLSSNDANWDSLMYDDIQNHSYDQISDKSKDKILDFDYNLPDFELFEPAVAKSSIKLEPTHTNSVSSSYLTDECSPTSSNNNSPVVKKVRKREFQTITDSSSEKSFALYENEGMRESEPASKSAKLRIMKKETVYHNTPRTIYKVSRDAKLEKTTREPLIIGNVIGNQRQIVKIRQTSATNTPYIMPGSIKTVNISKYSAKDSHFGDQLSSTTLQFLPSSSSSSSQNHYNSSSPAVAEHESDLLTGEFYDHEVDLYSDYKPRMGSSYIKQNLFSNSHQSSNTRTLFQTPIPQSGPLYLTEEEKRTLIQENYPIPTRVPLTKQEERNLKKVRRKIKNKLSAQESRRKKKEYVDSLEKKVEAYEQERLENKRRIETLENQQRTLQNQIRHYQHQIMNKVTGTGNTTSTGLMLFMICFALILVGGSMPSSFRKMSLPQSSLISSSSIYYMGYGPSQNQENKSRDLSIYEQNLRYKPDQFIDKTIEIDNIMPRQAILLGEESDDRNFEELVMSYSKINKRICGRSVLSDVTVIGSVDRVFNSNNNNQSTREWKILTSNGVTNRFANINFVK